MKNLVTLLFFFVLSVTCLAQSKDEIAIKKVIIDETDAFTKLNFEGQMSAYVRDANTTQQYNNADGSISVNEGWENINKDMRAYFKENPKVNFTKVTHTNWKMNKMSTDWYSVRFDQTMTDTKGKVGKSKENRIMHKVNGQWKIASMIALWDLKK